MLANEAELTQAGYQKIAGVDEAGRGPLAGPVVASAVILPQTKIAGINDSKKLTEIKRETVFKEIMLYAQVGIGIVPSEMIDLLNIFVASKLAMIRAINDLQVTPDFLLVDGKAMKLPLVIPQRNINRGDAKSLSIAAASIVAKVTRDRMMKKYHQKFPSYNFEQHKGYPTKEHVELLKKHGPSKIHRVTFQPVRELVQN